MLIARQPVFDRGQSVFGYELLYREIGKDGYTCDNGSIATSNVISGSFFSVNFSDYVGDKKVFIHFTQELLSGGVATLFPKEKLIIEMTNLGDVVSKELIKSCEKLHDIGYTLAFDVSVFKPGFERLIGENDIVKVDTLTYPEEFVHQIIDKYKNRVQFMAIKLEDKSIFHWAESMGFSYFQGYYFSKPDLMASNNLKPGKLSSMRMIKILQEPVTDFEETAQIIEMDVAFTYEILKLVNSAYYSRGNKVNSVKEAIVRLGENEIKKWGMFSALRKTAEATDSEVLNFSLVRARFMENFSKAVKLDNRSSEFLTVGILSMADELMNTTMERVIEGIKLSDNIADTLLLNNSDKDLYNGLMAIISCEKGDWIEVKRIADYYGLPLFSVAIIHNEAIRWALDIQNGINGGIE